MSFCRTHMHMHTHIHTRARACTHAHNTHARTHMHIHTRMHTYTSAQTHTNTKQVITNQKFSSVDTTKLLPLHKVELSLTIVIHHANRHPVIARWTWLL